MERRKQRSALMSLYHKIPFWLNSSSERGTARDWVQHSVRFLFFLSIDEFNCLRWSVQVCTLHCCVVLDWCNRPAIGTNCPRKQKATCSVLMMHHKIPYSIQLPSSRSQKLKWNRRVLGASFIDSFSFSHEFSTVHNMTVHLLCCISNIISWLERLEREAHGNDHAISPFSIWNTSDRSCQGIW